MHRIEIDAAARLVRIELTSFWTSESFEAFEQELSRSLLARGWQAGNYVALLDVRRRGVQSKEMSDQVRRARQDERRVLAPRRLAILVGGALVKMQAQRVNSAQDAIFYDEQEALAWLSEP